MWDKSWVLNQNPNDFDNLTNFGDIVRFSLMPFSLTSFSLMPFSLTSFS